MKAGKDWAHMTDLVVHDVVNMPTNVDMDDAPLLPRDAADQESWDALRRVV